MNTKSFNLMEKLYQKLLSKETKERSEQAILWIALSSFIVHLSIIGLIHLNIIYINEPSNLLKNPIAAIYTPFSFILVYEVYLLIYYLPKSTSTYISKQYEIIALIIIRRLFKDLSDLSLTSNWFNSNSDLQFTYDLVTSVLLFYLIYLFHIQRNKIYRTIENKKITDSSLSKFIKAKKWIATTLVPILLIIAIYSFFTWFTSILEPTGISHVSFKNINNIFFEQFFNILIIADVILLLFSFFHTDEFHKVIRNSGFVISTILIRISFSVSGIINNGLIISAILFGLLMLFIHNKFEKKIVWRYWRSQSCGRLKNEIAAITSTRPLIGLIHFGNGPLVNSQISSRPTLVSALLMKNGGNSFQNSNNLASIAALLASSSAGLSLSALVPIKAIGMLCSPHSLMKSRSICWGLMRKSIKTNKQYKFTRSCK